MDCGRQTTGTRDEQYNLVSVLYHSLKAADICDLYALDAESGGRTDLYEFFREAQVAHTQLAERARELLGISVDVPPGAGIAGPHAMPEEVLPPEEGLPPEAPPELDLPLDAPAGVSPPRPTRDRPEGGTSSELVPGEDAAGPGVPPDAPRTGEVPPRTGESPPSPSEPPSPRP